MRDLQAYATLARLFAGGSVYTYSLLPDYLDKISTTTLTSLSNALERGLISEVYDRVDQLVTLKLTRLGKRAVDAYRKHRRMAA